MISVEVLARAIAQADFIWELGESGVMACSPEMAGQMFSAYWNCDDIKIKFRYIAECVNAELRQ